MHFYKEKKSFLRRSIGSFFVVFNVLTCIVQAADVQTQIIIMRHGFKDLIKTPTGESEPEKMGNSNLSPEGLQQALALPSVLFPLYGEPSRIYVPNPTPPHTANLRPIATATPMAVATGQNLYNSFVVGQEAALGKELLSLKQARIYVVWEHHHIPAIAQALGVTDAPKIWLGEDFNSLWIITIHTDGTKTFKTATQDLPSKFPEVPFPYGSLRLHH